MRLTHEEVNFYVRKMADRLSGRGRLIAILPEYDEQGRLTRVHGLTTDGGSDDVTPDQTAVWYGANRVLDAERRRRHIQETLPGMAIR